MTNLSNLIADEKYLIESTSLEHATKVGQVYCYISSGPIPMIKIGKGKNGRQRMASWIKEYPPHWRNGKIVFIVDKMNQSTAETNLHKFFAEQRVPPEKMRAHLNIESWQRLPDGVSEWFYCDKFVKDSFRSVGIDLVPMYRDASDTPEEGLEVNWFEEKLYTALYHINHWLRGALGWTTLFITTILAISTWGSWIFFALCIGLGLYISALLFPND